MKFIVRIGMKVVFGLFSMNFIVLLLIFVIDFMSFMRFIDCVCGKLFVLVILCYGFVLLSICVNVNMMLFVLSVWFGLK